MRKIPAEYDNPIENICISIIDRISPYLKKLNFTANTLTTVSAIFGVYSIHLFRQKRYRESSAAFFISFMFDCFDGFYARKYDQVTTFGDYYDHIKDLLVGGTMFYLVYSNYRDNNFLEPFLGVAVLGVTVAFHLSCQEVYYNGSINGNQFLSVFRMICPCKNKTGLEKFMRYSRFFGLGTFMAYFSLLILYAR